MHALEVSPSRCRARQPWNLQLSHLYFLVSLRLPKARLGSLIALMYRTSPSTHSATLLSHRHPPIHSLCLLACYRFCPTTIVWPADASNLTSPRLYPAYRNMLERLQ